VWGRHIRHFKERIPDSDQQKGDQRLRLVYLARYPSTNDAYDKAMYNTSRKIVGRTLMICSDCGHTISMNKICETPLRSATDMLKHMADHSASRAFSRPEIETFAAVELSTPRGAPADHLKPAIIQLNSVPLPFEPAECASFQLRVPDSLIPG
jgi:hypothetical protein